MENETKQDNPRKKHLPKWGRSKINKMRKMRTDLEKFYDAIREYKWKTGEWNHSGVARNINEREVMKFMDFVDSKFKELNSEVKK